MVRDYIRFLEGMRGDIDKIKSIVEVFIEKQFEEVVRGIIDEEFNVRGLKKMSFFQLNMFELNMWSMNLKVISRSVRVIMFFGLILIVLVFLLKNFIRFVLVGGSVVFFLLYFFIFFSFLVGLFKFYDKVFKCIV